MHSKIVLLALFALAGNRCALGEDAIDGFTEPFRKIELAPAEPGVLTTLLAKEGDAVNAWQLLGTLDNDVLQIAVKLTRQVLDSRGKLQAAKAEYQLRSGRLKQLRDLHPQGFSHREEIDRAAADVMVAEANILVLEEQRVLDELEYQKAQALLERRQIRSPIDGVITKVHHDAGEYVAGNNPVVFTVVQLNPLRAVFAIPAAQASKLQVLQAVTLRFPDSGQQTTGTIELVSPIIDAESGLVRVKVLIPNADGQQPCGARCLLSSPANALSATALSVGERSLP